METFYNVTQFAQMLNVGVKTLQKWDRDGVLVARRTPTNRRYYTHSQYLEFIGKGQEPLEKKKCIYARVNGSSRVKELQDQIDLVTNYMHSKGISVDDIYTDYGSSMNYNRPSWNQLINDCIDGKISQIYIAHEDRFVRFGFAWIASLLSGRFGVQIHVLNDSISSPDREIISDLIGIIHIFSDRIYGLKKYKRLLSAEFFRGGDDNGESD